MIVHRKERLLDNILELSWSSLSDLHNSYPKSYQNAFGKTRDNKGNMLIWTNQRGRSPYISYSQSVGVTSSRQKLRKGKTTKNTWKYILFNLYYFFENYRIWIFLTKTVLWFWQPLNITKIEDTFSKDTFSKV
jgi:hypothetical protein